MVRPSAAASDALWSRRAVLAGAGSTAAFAVAGGSAAAATASVPRTVVIPTVDEFEGNYTGQFLTVYGPARESDVQTEAPVTELCPDAPWPADATAVNAGQLTDRYSDRPVAVRLPVYMDGRQTDLVEDALFVVNQAYPCGEDYIRLDTVSVSGRSIIGKPMGPTVAAEEADLGDEAEATPGGSGPGFGLLAGALGLAGGVLARALRESGE